MNIYFTGEVKQRLDLDLINKLWNKTCELFLIESDTFKENSLLILNERNHLNLSQEIEDSIKNTKNKTLLIIHHNKSLDTLFIDDQPSQNCVESYKKIIENFNFKQKNVYFITQLTKDITNIKNTFPEVNVFAYDRWLQELHKQSMASTMPLFYPNSINLPNKKFSIFCNRYDKFRLQVFSELIVNNIIDDCHYTFANHYNHPIQEMNNEILEEYYLHRPAIENWLKHAPYNLININIDGNNHTFYPFELKYYFESSKIHIVLETEPNSNSYLTEKTYKAIFYKKPFLLISQKNALEALKAEGYKTFSPFIDESYDSYDSIRERLKAVIKEVKRLQSLSESELDNIVKNCQAILEFNFEKLHENVNKPVPEEFKFKHMLTFNND